MIKKSSKTIDDYIKQFPKNIQIILKKIRETIRKAAPGVEETTSYQMPAFKLNGKYLVYFGAWKNHIGFYAMPSGNEAFKHEIAKYQNAKGSVQFPLDEPIPYGLISRVVKFRVKENQEKAVQKNRK
jgi:uncharacterized protein YdhG (YjbR/CyaY superfamily)